MSRLRRFLAWLVQHLPHQEEIRLTFLVMGHTHIWCDSCFASIKKWYIGNEVACLADLLHGICSTKNNVAVPVMTEITAGPGVEPAVKVNVPMHDWSELLSSDWLASIPNLTWYHDFSVRKDKPWVVVCKRWADSTVGVTERIGAEDRPCVREVSLLKPCVRPRGR